MKKTILLLALLMLSVGSAFAKPNYNYTVPAGGVANTVNQTLQGQVVYIPVGVTTNAVLATNLDSDNSVPGSSVVATLVSDFAYNGKTIAPKGSVLNGIVTTSKSAGRANRNAQIGVRFNSITTPQGYTIPISAVIKTEDNTGILKGGTKKDAAVDYAKNAGLGAGSGAILGTALGALAGGSVGKGAVYGTALGGGMGLAKSLWDRGGSVEIPANSTIEIYFDQPITVSAPNYTYEY